MGADLPLIIKCYVGLRVDWVLLETKKKWQLYSNSVDMDRTDDII